MNIEDMIMNGASEEEINEALNQIKAEKARQEEALRQSQIAKNSKEALKAEARAYTINALVAYTEAFDLLGEGETIDDEDVAELEKLLIKIENMIPVYFKLFQMNEDLEEDFGFGLGGLFK